MKVPKFAPVTLLVALLLPLGAPPANATPAATGSHDIVEVCEGNSLSLTRDDGTRLEGTALATVLRSVQNICRSEQGGQATEPFAASTYYNVVADAAYNASNGWITVKAWANSLPRAYYELSCVYRSEPVNGTAGAWKDCGVVADTNTSLTTRGNSFCPVQGTRWHVRAELYNKAGTRLNYDDDWAVAF